MKDDVLKAESEAAEEPGVRDPETDEVPADVQPDGSPSTTASDEIAILKDQLLRTLAEFENYKKRSLKEYQSIVQMANEKLLIDLLPAIDDLERALKVAKDLKFDDAKVQQSFQGFENIYKKLMRILGEKGLKPMESIGKELDVNLHDAMMQVDGEGQGANVIVDEHEKGYYLHDKVVRHAKVIVTK